ncbi:MAG: peptidylprolyl isomerase [Bradyrhizobiaceae bacterium]|nr:peptidylprolyl isomerase [Bradyrhizobiaceae bacterium]
MILPALPLSSAGETGVPRRRLALPAVAAAGFAALLAMAAPAPAEAPAGDPIVAKINGLEIHQSDLNLAEEDIGRELPTSDEAGKRDYLINYVTDLMLVAQAAEAKKIPDTAEFRQRLAFLRNKALMETVLGQEAKDAVSEPTLRKIYEDATKNAAGEEEVRARHILFRVADPNDQAASKAAESKVKDTIERLNKGEDFGKLATALTEDPSGKQNGGDLGYFTRDQMVPEFSEVAFGLEKGQISGPVKTQFGWHVLKVEDRRKREPPPFDQVRGEIQEYAVRRAQTDFVKKLRAEAKIERLDKPAAPPPAK